MDIHFFAKSDVGRVRLANEDFFLNEKIGDNEYLFIVADGMGGHQAGDVASQLASQTFLDSYRGARKKNTAIGDAMEIAIRKANTVVFRRAAADAAKHGMGTTFSALVVAGMKAAIAHVGDSRIYLLRGGRIRRLTTDHSFVEKLVEEGRISIDEARDHPQKNVLYMSLGARESFVPEMQANIALEDGDGLLMCSDGLSNMVDDQTLLHLAMGDYPEEAADAMVSLANAHGGSDNITVQVIRIGSLETLEKTKPIRVSRPRRRLITAIAALLLLVLLAALVYFAFSADTGGNRAAPPAAVRPPAAWAISEVAPARFAGQRPAAADCRFLSGGRLHAVQAGRLVVFDLAGEGMRSLELAVGDQVVPTPENTVYLLRREPARMPAYRLLRQGERRPLLRLQGDTQLSSKETRDDGSVLHRIAGLQGEVVPEYADSFLFIFRDGRRYYAVRGWTTAQGLSAPIEDLAVGVDTRLFFSRDAGRTTMLFSDPAAGRIALYRLDGVVEKVRDFTATAQPPLLLEYRDNHSLVGYYPERCLQLDVGRLAPGRVYADGGGPRRAVKVMADMAGGDCLLINDSNRFFMLSCST